MTLAKWCWIPVALSVVGLSCRADYGFIPKNGGGAGDDTAVEDPGDTEDIDPPDTEDDTGEPPSPPPVLMESDCPEDARSSISDSVYVLSWDSTTASTEITAGGPGWYHLYDYSIVESGASQTNESAYLRIRNAQRPSGEPLWGNCGSDWVVQDADNQGALAQGTRIYMGTFWLEAGTNQLELVHYCPIYRSGACGDLHITDDPGATCDSGNVNSVHLEGQGICLMPGFI